MGFTTAKQSISGVIFACMIVCALLAAFSLHSVQISHHHPGDGGHPAPHEREDSHQLLILGEHMHATDKKLLFILAALTLLAGGTAISFRDSWVRFVASFELLYAVFLRHRRNVGRSLCTYLQRQFSRGILHPKLHSPLVP